jgi:nucleoside-diphosphate kinase
MGNRTLAIIKPDAVGKGYTGKIIDRILSTGFNVLGARLVHLSREKAEGFYAVHKKRPFFNDLIDFMTSGPCMPLVVEHDGAVNAFRTLIGSTNPAEADEGTIRKDFAESIQNNAVHGSDSDENAEKEIAFFFTSKEIHPN